MVKKTVLPRGTTLRVSFDEESDGYMKGEEYLDITTSKIETNYIKNLSFSFSENLHVKY